MHTNSLTLPFLPGPSPRSKSTRNSSESATGAAWHWFRQLDLRPLAAGGKPQRENLAARHAEKRLNKRARRGQGIQLGTRELPYEPLALGGAPLAALQRFDGLAITITTRSTDILEQIELLVELDQRHAITVDLLIASHEPGSPDLEESLRTVSALSAHGITTRLVLTDPPQLPLSGDVASRFRHLFEAARACRAFDVAAVPLDGATGIGHGS